MTTIRCPVNEAADTSRDEPALITENRKIIYYEYDRYLAATAEQLKRAGCGEGRRVGLALPNQWRYAVLLMALFRVRAVACPIDPALSRDEIERRSSRLSCQRVITAAEAEDLVRFLVEAPAANERVHLDLEQTATILWTGGRDQRARAVQHSLGSHYYSAKGSNHNRRSSSGSRWLLSTPIHRSSGLEILMRCAMSGAAVVLAETPEAIEDVIDAYGVTHMSLSPEQIEALLRGGFDASRHPSLRAVDLRSRATQPALVERARASHIPLYPSYELTEMASEIAAMRPDSAPQKQLTSGVVLKYREARIAADGEILVKGRTLFDGYIEDDGLRPAVDAEGWFATGDLGHMDSDGYLTVIGRKAGAD